MKTWIAILRIKIFTQEEEPVKARIEAVAKAEELERVTPNAHLESLNSMDDILKGDV